MRVKCSDTQEKKVGRRGRGGVGGEGGGVGVGGERRRKRKNLGCAWTWYSIWSNGGTVVNLESVS